VKEYNERIYQYLQMFMIFTIKVTILHRLEYGYHTTVQLLGGNYRSIHYWHYRSQLQSMKPN